MFVASNHSSSIPPMTRERWGYNVLLELISSGGSISFSLRYLWAIGTGVIIEIVLVIVGGDGGEMGWEKLLAHVCVSQQCPEYDSTYTVPCIF